MTKPLCPAALKIIKAAEGLELTAYRCSSGVPSIGYGSTRGLTEADIGKLTITEAEAEARLAEDVLYASQQVDKAVLVPLTENQRGALVSFCYNTGPGAKGVKDGLVTLKEGGPSTLLKRLNEGNYAAAAEQFLLWTRSNGKILNGLKTRRAAERALFLTPDGQEAVVPVPHKPTVAVSEVGSGAKYSALAGFPIAWVIITVWNALLPQSPMPMEVAMGLSSAISTGAYLLGDYISSRCVPKTQVESEPQL